MDLERIWSRSGADLEWILSPDSKKFLGFRRSQFSRIRNFGFCAWRRPRKVDFLGWLQGEPRILAQGEPRILAQGEPRILAQGESPESWPRESPES